MRTPNSESPAAKKLEEIFVPPKVTIEAKMFIVIITAAGLEHFRGQDVVRTHYSAQLLSELEKNQLEAARGQRVLESETVIPEMEEVITVDSPALLRLLASAQVHGGLNELLGTCVEIHVKARNRKKCGGCAGGGDHEQLEVSTSDGKGSEIRQEPLARQQVFAGGSAGGDRY